MTDFSKATETVNGTKVKDLKFNAMANKWTGFIWWEESSRDDKFTSMTWTKTGKATNPGHNLKL